MHYVQKNNLFLAKLPGISVIRIKMIHAITSRLVVIFLEILNFWKIYNPNKDLKNSYKNTTDTKLNPMMLQNYSLHK